MSLLDQYTRRRPTEVHQADTLLPIPGIHADCAELEKGDCSGGYHVVRLAVPNCNIDNDRQGTTICHRDQLWCCTAEPAHDLRVVYPVPEAGVYPSRGLSKARMSNLELRGKVTKLTRAGPFWVEFPSFEQDVVHYILTCRFEADFDFARTGR
jgi:hypothetical protein